MKMYLYVMLLVFLPAFVMADVVAVGLEEAPAVQAMEADRLIAAREATRVVSSTELLTKPRTIAIRSWYVPVSNQRPVTDHQASAPNEVGWRH